MLITTNLPFDERTEMLGAARLSVAMLDRLTHQVNILEITSHSHSRRQSSRTAETSS